MPAGLSSWCVLCGKAGSSGLMSGTSPRRSLRPTCCGQITAWSQTGQLQACHMCLPPSPSCQGMRNPITLPKSTCPLRYDTPRACHKQHAICTGIAYGLERAHHILLSSIFFRGDSAAGSTWHGLHGVNLHESHLLPACSHIGNAHSQRVKMQPPGPNGISLATSYCKHIAIRT